MIYPINDICDICKQPASQTLVIHHLFPSNRKICQHCYIAELCAAVVAQAKIIEELEEKIKELELMHSCEGCRHINSKGYPVCLACDRYCNHIDHYEKQEDK